MTNIMQTSSRTHPWDERYICQHLVDVYLPTWKPIRNQPSNKPMLANIPWDSYGMMWRIINHQRLDLQNQPLDPPIHVGNNIYPFFHGNPSWVMVTLHKARDLFSNGQNRGIGKGRTKIPGFKVRGICRNLFKKNMFFGWAAFYSTL